ncbi:MAG: protein kinase [Labilithrix sp.]|nr:protein kinase [Labilithrix sp.]MCW5814778.1 protein kinase [Labilithrix sp.]
MQRPSIPGFELGAELGHGAHSVVYRGKKDGVPCAVKLPRMRARWTRLIYREAVALARVKHGGLPRVLTVGDADGFPYLAMELVEGQTLADRLNGSALQEPELLAIALQLADALAAVHDAGLVHRDVKARNIVVDHGRVVLVDFGFTTPMERTGDGETAGTAAYAAPEQLVPPGRVDARTDLFGLGRVLLECVSRELFSTTSSTADVASLRELLVGGGVSAGLAEVIAHLLQHDASRRYPDARALMRELDRLSRGLPVLGAAAYVPERALSLSRAREDECARALDAVSKPGDGGRMLLLQGTRGSGKTFLLHALEAQLRHQGRVSLTTSAKDDPPLSGLRRILESCVAGGSPASRGMAGHELSELLGNLSAVGELIAPIVASALHPGSPPEEPELPEATEAFEEGAAELIVRIARRLGRLVLLVDDVQWMDLASAAALLRLAHRLADSPVVLVLASRPESPYGVPTRFASVRAADVPVRTIELGPLDAEGVARVIQAHLCTDPVDRELVRRVCAFADGTALGVLEVLSAYVDAGAIRPHDGAWVFDEARAAAIVLPRGVLALLARRVGELPQAARRVLEAAAVCGLTFSESLVARTRALTEETVGYAMVGALRAGVVERVGEGEWRFLHDSMRDTLLADLSDAESRHLHQRAGTVLSESERATGDDLLRAARHFALGEPAQDPERVHRVACAAAAAALRRHDDEAVLELHALAVSSAKLAGLALSADLHRLAGEASFRLGAIDDAVAAFERALAATHEPLARAILYGRIAWAYETNGDVERAWDELGRAFAEMGARLPVEDVASVAATTVNVARILVDRMPTRARTAAETDLLCRLHYQNFRMAFEYGRVGRAVHSSIASYGLSANAAPATRARAQVVYGFVLSVLGRRAAGTAAVQSAVALAKTSGDPTVEAFCTQMEGMTLSWGGDFATAVACLRRCVDVYGPWIELTELTHVSLSCELMITVSGRPLESWAWIDGALARLRRARAGSRMDVWTFHRARALLASLGRTPEPGSWLAARLAEITVRDGGKGYFRLLSWGPRAAYYVETGDLGADFEALVAEFAAENHDPRRVHPTVGEFYLAVAYARLHQCLHATEDVRPRSVRALAAAVADLRAGTRLPVVKAHAGAIEGALAWLSDKPAKAAKLLAEGEAIAIRENFPWVLYSVARVRAHILREDGKPAAARDQARVAATLAREHGAIARLHVIREEFDLGEAAPEEQLAKVSRMTVRSSSSRTNRHLAALLQVARSPRRDLKAEQQAAVILDELVESLRAERGAIWFQPETPSAGMAVARQRGSVLSTSVAPDSPRGSLLRSVQRNGIAWPSEQVEHIEAEPAIDPTRTLVVPLYLYDACAGSLAMERSMHDPPFAVEDRQLLELLAHQVPIALEIARLLYERERLHVSLQQAKKMEAIGQLAGGLAHDFNNMLAAMKVALGAAQERATEDSEMAVELDIIAQATTRASQLTHQLLSFSRNQSLPVSIQDVNQLIAAIEPMLRRVANEGVDVMLKLSPVVDTVEVDQASFDQALMNLLINARDAMPNGGTFTIATRNVVLDENAAARASLTPGAYVEVEVADTGEGMSQDTLSRIFEPFFTTKPAGRGTGLGLATVYAFAKNCGGGIDVQSEPGSGTQFRLYLKRAERRRVSRPARRQQKIPSTTPAPGAPPDTILVIDDDDLVRRSIAKILERNGYRVVAASGSAEALDVARTQGARIGLVIMDVLLPGVTGPELGRRLGDLLLPAKLLFVSGFSADSAPIEDANVSAEMLLQKPFSQIALLERVRKLMPS